MTQTPSKGTDQAATLRGAALPSSRTSNSATRVVAVVSGKGGVGKTTIATNLAVLAARAGARVLLLDGDLALANVDIALGTRARRTVRDALDGTCALSDVLADGPAGIKILAASVGMRDMADLSSAQQATLLNGLASLEAQFDVLLIDCGAGIGANVQFLAAAAAQTVLVVTSDPTSLMDAYATAKVLTQLGVDNIDIVVNNVQSDAEARDTFGRLLAVTGRFLPVCLHFCGGLPRDESVRRSLRARRAVVENAPHARITTALRHTHEMLFRRDMMSAPARPTVWWSRILKQVLGASAAPSTTSSAEA